MISESELSLRNLLDKTMVSSINGITKTFHECPMFYLSEEDIRCDLYRKVSNDYSHSIFLENPHVEPFVSNAVHVEAINRLPNESGRERPDLMAYFAVTSRKDPISVLTNSKKPENVYFLKKSDGKHNKKRIITEIKFTDHTRNSGKVKGVMDDLNKISEWESWKKYMLYFDRSNKLDEKKEFKDIIDNMKRMSEKKDGDIEFYYMGMPTREKEERIYHYVNGILKR